VLERAGWQAHAALSSIEGLALAARILAGPAAAHTVILTDMHMPGDPDADGLDAAAGAYLALRLRARMAAGELPRAPIVAITGMPLAETRLAALACGCDALVDKSPPLDLAARVTAELEHAYRPARPLVVDALLRQAQPAREAMRSPARPHLTVADVNAALLAYRRYGLVGLGQSALARALTPPAASALQRGQAAYAWLMECLDALAALDAGEAAAMLRAEMEGQLSPAAQYRKLAQSQATYYLLRRGAIKSLADLLAQDGLAVVI
jgi:CheY-like chemotaxis protein